MRVVKPTKMLVALLALAALVGCSGEQERRPVVLATTTSTHDTGLLEHLVPEFERSTGYAVKTVAVGTGKALELARRGEADVLLVHAPARELEFVAAGHGRNRRPVMHNDFVIVGPATDPVGIKGGADAVAALRAIAVARAPWITRGDGSGTHSKELELWQAAAVKGAGDWVSETGQGMGASLRIASERGAYILADRGTFIASEGLALTLLVEGDERLFNPYHVIEVSGEHVNRTGGAKLADFFVAPKTQARIGAFVFGGQQLFHPDAVQ